jgi:hypothetical protein
MHLHDIPPLDVMCLIETRRFTNGNRQGVVRVQMLIIKCNRIVCFLSSFLSLFFLILRCHSLALKDFFGDLGDPGDFDELSPILVLDPEAMLLSQTLANSPSIVSLSG